MFHALSLLMRGHQGPLKCSKIQSMGILSHKSLLKVIYALQMFCFFPPFKTLMGEGFLDPGSLWTLSILFCSEHILDCYVIIMTYEYWWFCKNKENGCTKIEDMCFINYTPKQNNQKQCHFKRWFYLIKLCFPLLS